MRQIKGSRANPRTFQKMRISQAGNIFLLRIRFQADDLVGKMLFLLHEDPSAILRIHIKTAHLGILVLRR